MTQKDGLKSCIKRSPYEIKQMASVDMITAGNSPYHKYIMLLYCLDPKTNYPAKIKKDILDLKLKELQSNFRGNKKEIIDKVIEDFIGRFFSDMEAGTYFQSA